MRAEGHRIDCQHLRPCDASRWWTTSGGGRRFDRLTTDRSKPIAGICRGAEGWSRTSRARADICSLSGNATASGGLGKERRNMRRVSKARVP